MTPNATFRALIVDDEAAPRLHLCNMLSAHPEIQIIGESVSAHEALSMIASFSAPPDVIFLDVQMPTADGFSLIPTLNDTAHVILVTSFDRFALKGFDAGVLDYLLKPVNRDRLAESLRRLQQAPAKNKSRSQLSLESIVTVGDAEQAYAMALSQIAGIQAEGNYSRIYASDGSPSRLMLRNLAGWEALLPVPPFARIDRSFIVNLHHVRDFSKESRNLAWLSLEGVPENFSVGRTASIRLRNAMRRLNTINW